MLTRFLTENRKDLNGSKVTNFLLFTVQGGEQGGAVRGGFPMHSGGGVCLIFMSIFIL